MIAKTHSDNLIQGNPLTWQTRLGMPFLFICLCACLGYLCWTSQKVFVFVQVGLLVMAIAYLKPFRKTVAPTEICLDLFAVVMAFAVFVKLYEIVIEQPSLNFLHSVNQVELFREWVMRWPIWLVIVCNYIIADCIAYWNHRMFHTQQWLWNSHAFHHSSKHLNWLSGMRVTLGHTVGLFLPYAFVGVFFPLPIAGIVATSMLIFDTLNQHYLHSNIRFPFQKRLEWLFVTPRFHFVHHSVTRKFSDSNYGFVLTIWDRMFGTYTDPDLVDPNEPLGLNYEISTWRLMIGLPPKKTAAKK